MACDAFTVRWVFACIFTQSNVYGRLTTNRAGIKRATSDIMGVRAWLLLVALVGTTAGEQCYPPYQPQGGMCVYINKDMPLSWQEARDFCASMAGDGATSDLAIFPTCDAFTIFAGYLGFTAPPNSTFWVGAHTEFTVNNWRWLDGEPLATGVPYWAYSEGHDEGEDCAAMDSKSYFQLADFNCDGPRFSICSMPMMPQASVKDDPEYPQLNCPYDSIQIGEYCYWFSSSRKSWTSAEDYCRTHYSSNMGELFSPSSCDEFTKMANHLEVAERDKSHWVGAADISGHQEWFWVNGDPVPGGPPFWATDFPLNHPASGPNDFCGLMSSTKRFYLVDKKCTDYNYFICKLHIVEAIP
ncbi:uncharacterized protein [Panulirus ornatus]|uniref:uncharacterized protein n=1 Tax=Panulirus ornatus TaxID=150431 RepID=UPI003A8C13FD